METSIAELAASGNGCDKMPQSQSWLIDEELVLIDAITGKVLTCCGLANKVRQQVLAVKPINSIFR